MILKSEKAFTGIDITIALMIVVIFVGTIAALFYNYNISSKQIERNGKATQIAINSIEEIKNSDFSIYENKTLDETKDPEKGVVYQDELVEQGYYRTAIITDYTDEIGNEGKTFGITKKVKVTVTYKQGSNEEKIDLSTIISKEK